MLTKLPLLFIGQTRRICHFITSISEYKLLLTYLKLLVSVFDPCEFDFPSCHRQGVSSQLFQHSRARFFSVSTYQNFKLQNYDRVMLCSTSTFIMNQCHVGHICGMSDKILMFYVYFINNQISLCECVSVMSHIHTNTLSWFKNSTDLVRTRPSWNRIGRLR